MELEKEWEVKGKPPQWRSGKPKGFRVQLYRCEDCGASLRVYPDKRR